MVCKIGTECVNWREFLLNLIENIEDLDIISYDDHIHPLVKMTFEESKSDESLLFSSFVTDTTKDTRQIIVNVLDQLDDSKAMGFSRDSRTPSIERIALSAIEGNKFS